MDCAIERQRLDNRKRNTNNNIYNLHLFREPNIERVRMQLNKFNLIKLYSIKSVTRYELRAVPTDIAV